MGPNQLQTCSWVIFISILLAMKPEFKAYYFILRLAVSILLHESNSMCRFQ